MPSRGERVAARGARRGISLFEAVAAMTIIGLVSVSALGAVGAELRTAERARRAIEAEALAVQRLDAIDLLTDADLRALPDSLAEGSFEEPFEEYGWTTTSAPVEEQAGVYRVVLQIGWPAGSYTVRTYAYRRPPLATRRR